jgi:hypothetical protein
MLNSVEQSLGDRATFIGGVWIQALMLLGPREVVRTAANIPRPCSAGGRSELYGQNVPPCGAAFVFSPKFCARLLAHEISSGLEDGASLELGGTSAIRELFEA